MPFDQRFPRLLERLGRADAHTLPILLAAATGVLDPPNVGLSMPARVVGGRVAPPAWRPQTYEELHADQRAAGRSILLTLAALPGMLLDPTLEFLVDHVRTFARHRLLDELRELFDARPLSEECRIRLVRRIDTVLRHRRQDTPSSEGIDEIVGALEAWRTALAPPSGDLESRVRELTARPEEDYWVDERHRRRYAQLADAVLSEPGVMDRLIE